MQERLLDWWPAGRVIEEDQNHSPDDDTHINPPLTDQAKPDYPRSNHHINGAISASAALRLSEVIAALNAAAAAPAAAAPLPSFSQTTSLPSMSMDDCTSISSHKSVWSIPMDHHNQGSSSPPAAIVTSPPQVLALCQTPVTLKLSRLNSQQHKVELLRKLNCSQTAALPNASPIALHIHPGAAVEPAESNSIEKDDKHGGMVIGKRHKPSKWKGGSLHQVSDRLIQKEDAAMPMTSRRELHILSERQRRKGMTNLYSTLLSLLPETKPKTDRSTVLTEAINYIHSLQKTVEELANQKAKLLASAESSNNPDYSSSEQGHGLSADHQHRQILSDEMKEILATADVTVRFCNKDAFITLNGPKRRGVWSGILHILQKHSMEPLNVTLSTANDLNYHCIHAKMSESSKVDSQELQKMVQNLILHYAKFKS